MDGAHWTVRVVYEADGTTTTDEFRCESRPSLQLWPDGRGLVRRGVHPDTEDVHYSKVYRMERTRGR